MAPGASCAQDFSHLEDVLGNMPFVRRYIVLCLFFELDGVTNNQVENALVRALGSLNTAFPHLAGRVVIDGMRPGNSGICRIVAYKDSTPLITKDLTTRTNIPSFSQLHNAGFPFSMLDADVLAPPIASTWDQDHGPDQIAPVLILQANFITGGLILTFNGNHTMMDMTGLGLVISLFSKACRNEPFSEEDLRLGNQPKRSVVPLLGDDYRPGTELDTVFIDPSNTFAAPSTPLRWAYWNFSADSLARLKDQASKQTTVSYITTDDAIGALCWQRVAKARQERLGDGVKSYFARPCSMRKYLGLQGYIGHMVDTLFVDEVDVWSRPLCEVAASLRKMLQQDEEIVHHVRAVATMLSRLDDRSVMINGVHLDPNRDIVLSSYANIKCCQQSYGPILGQAHAARRPKMPPWPSLCYLMPRAKDGSMALAMCMSEDDLTILREDEVLNSFAEYIG
ncbi:trichothecene 3-O-acetyltransferase-like protein [Elsinoe australis]|uniref:Trichothecene 3-O-acetyltransferase-like protein n=1 Tax=Elsinoe australis TaxID=40998 RepID=A0A4U7BCU3_9PEZI|nr:trichothecene 3-O-acetyltransferase-like protein [Elsinoe australis]